MMEPAAASDARSGTRSRERPYVDALLHLAALSIVAGAIHAVAAPPHFAETWARGAFFLVLAAFQLAWGALVYARPSSRALRVGAAVNLLVIGVWIGSRAVGAPFGPDQWQ